MLLTLWMQAGEFEHVLVLVVDALCRLRASDAVHGLLVWSRDVTGRRMNWIKSAVDIATAKYVIGCAYSIHRLDYLTDYWTAGNHNIVMHSSYHVHCAYCL